MAMIEITGLHKSFGKLAVLRGVDLTIEKGESMTVIGGSGSGKSVLIKHVIGLLFPDKGRVIVEGQVMNDLDEFGLNALRKKFGMLFQMAALLIRSKYGRTSGSRSSSTQNFLTGRSKRSRPKSLPSSD